MSLSHANFVYFGYILVGNIAESWGNSMFTFLKKQYTVSISLCLHHCPHWSH